MATVFENTDLFLATERARLEIIDAAKGIRRPYPEYSTGARSVIRINNKRIAAALEVNWSINIEHQELRSIDSYLPWELIPGQVSIEASLRRFVHPDSTAAGDGLFTIIQAALHTPYAELEVRDRLGTLLFFARGSFTSLQGAVAQGQVTVESVKFQGYYWKQNDEQGFVPGIKNLNLAEQEAKIIQSKTDNLVGSASQLVGA